MRKSKYPECQIADTLKRSEHGVAIKPLCRKLEASAPILCQWRPRHRGTQTSDLKRLREHEEENWRRTHRYPRSHWIR